MTNPPKTKFLIMASGLGITHRGFETSAVQWHKCLQNTGRVDLLLLSGGTYPGAVRVRCVSPYGLVASTLRNLKLISDGARLRQLSFWEFAKKKILEFEPNFIWLQEFTLAVKVQQWLRRKKLTTRLIFCNGAPISPALCLQFDMVVDLIPSARDALLGVGYDDRRSCLIPYPMSLAVPQLTREDWRRSMGYKDSDKVIICVAAWNCHHKRIDYLIDEVHAARRSNPHIKLLLCGQATEDTHKLKAMGHTLLGDDIKWLTLQPKELAACYFGCDVFVLPSKNEAFGAVLVEAALAGLPVICNSFPSAHYILGNDYPGIANLTEHGQLSQLLESDHFTEAFPQIVNITQERFNGKNLAEQLLQFLEKQHGEGLKQS